MCLYGPNSILFFRAFSIKFVLGTNFSIVSNTCTVNVGQSSPSTDILQHCQDFSVVVVVVMRSRITKFCIQSRVRLFFTDFPRKEETFLFKNFLSFSSKFYSCFKIPASCKHPLCDHIVASSFY